jgi:hypothetical protein
MKEASDAACTDFRTDFLPRRPVARFVRGLVAGSLVASEKSSAHQEEGRYPKSPALVIYAGGRRAICFAGLFSFEYDGGMLNSPPFLEKSFLAVAILLWALNSRLLGRHLDDWAGKKALFRNRPR